jgi:hypothetical protein
MIERWLLDTKEPYLLFWLVTSLAEAFKKLLS